MSDAPTSSKGQPEVDELVKLVSTKAIGRGKANGTFGELIQGPLDLFDNHNLVTLPISAFSHAVFVPEAADAPIRSSPASKAKSREMAARLLSLLNIRIGGTIFVSSELPEGKGLASSSADIVATARAIFNWAGHPFDITLVESILRMIEPTDGVLHTGVVSYFHRRAQLNVKLGRMFDWRIIYLDEGGIVDTVAYNHTIAPYSAGEVEEYRTMHREIVNAFQQNDERTVARLSTRSAIIAQRRHYKRFLQPAIEIAGNCGALGVVVTHSGPCVGVAVSASEPNHEDKCARIETHLRSLGVPVFCVNSLTS